MKVSCENPDCPVCNEVSDLIKRLEELVGEPIIVVPASPERILVGLLEHFGRERMALACDVLEESGGLVH